jgi:sulfonate transport system substrate-binding protein
MTVSDPFTAVTHSRRHLLRALAALPALGAWDLMPSPAQAQDKLPKSVRIGYQKSVPVVILARKQASIEKRLQALSTPVAVQWVEFQFGPPMLEALSANAIDLGVVGDTPPIFAQVGGSALVYAAAVPSWEHAVLVRRDSPIRTLADLKGKRVAFGKGTSAHNFIIKALALAGLKLSDIVPVYLSPTDATTAFSGGNIDVWAVWDPYYAIAQQHYDARSIADTSDKRLASAGYYMAGRDFATRYPSVLVAVLQELGKTTVWAGHHRDELTALAAEVTGIDTKSWATIFARTNLALGPMTDAHVAMQQQLADTFYALGIIPRKIKVSDIVWHAPGLAVYQG